MKFFLDSANLGEIREAAELGLIDGVTTNPSLIAKEGGVDFKRHIAAVCEVVAGDVSAEVTSLDTEGMLREGREYARIAPNVMGIPHPNSSTLSASGSGIGCRAGWIVRSPAATRAFAMAVRWCS